MMVHMDHKPSLHVHCNCCFFVFLTGYHGPNSLEQAKLPDQVLETMRKEVERCDCFCGTVMMHSVAGGTGAGRRKEPVELVWGWVGVTRIWHVSLLKKLAQIYHLTCLSYILMAILCPSKKKKKISVEKW